MQTYFTCQVPCHVPTLTPATMAAVTLKHSAITNQKCFP